jgi:hypothetical protein
MCRESLVSEVENLDWYPIPNCGRFSRHNEYVCDEINDDQNADHMITFDEFREMWAGESDRGNLGVLESFLEDREIVLDIR